MDNFMDKLAKRFNAGEIIKANAQAEAREMKRMQEQAVQYEKLMQEMRRLNLKNVEVTEQVQQLIVCGIEQIESYENSAAVLEGVIRECEGSLGHRADDEILKMEQFERSMESLMNHNQQMLSQSIQNLEDKVGKGSDVAEEMAALQTGLNAQKYALEDISRQLNSMTNELRMGLDEGQKKLEEHVHKENVRVYRNVQAVVVDEATKKARELGDRLDQIERGMKRSKGVKGLLWVTILLSLASIAMQVLQMLQII